MRKTIFLGILGVSAALAGCSAADGGSGEPVEQSSESTAAVTATNTATISGIGTFAVSSFQLATNSGSGPTEVTFTAPLGWWVPRLEQENGRLISSVQINIASHTYTMSNVMVSSVYTLYSLTQVKLVFQSLSAY
jgi:hypothetical protein